MPLPPKMLSGTTRMYAMDFLQYEHEKASNNDPTKLRYNVKDNLLGFVLPPFQRPLVWTMEQKQKFIESAWLGIGIGTYVYNKSHTKMSGFDENTTDRWLIDGQQRLTAVKDFFEDKVAIFDGVKYSDMTEKEKRQFCSTPFAAHEVSSDDPAYLETLYHRMNFGGTPHLDPNRVYTIENEQYELVPVAPTSQFKA